MFPTCRNSEASDTARCPSHISLRRYLMSDTAIIIIGMALGGLLAGSAHAANLVTNGGFETENLGGGGNPISPPPGWTITGDGISIDSTFSYTGTYDIAFGATSSDPSPGRLAQSIATTPGQAYNLSFALVDQVGQSSDTFTVMLGGFSQTLTGDQAPFSYTIESFVIPGADITGISTSLGFVGINELANWNLDDVSLTPVAMPEPPTVLLFGTLATTLLWSVRRRRLNQSG
jgi:hypothetical protein